MLYSEPAGRSDTFVVVNVAVVDVVVGGVAAVAGGGIVVGSSDIVAFVVVVDDNVSKEWLSLLLVSAASLQLNSIGIRYCRHCRYCRHFFVSSL